MSNAPLHLVLGAGQVGPLVAERLRARGFRVRIGRRTATAARVAGIEQVALDVRDPHAVARAAEGAEVVYHCVNPLYHQWPEMLLPMTRGIVEGTTRARARLVALDNVYMYGDTARITEESIMAPCSRKGELRVQAARIMLDADARGDARVAVGRAADWFGPHGTLSMIFGERFFQRVLAGKPAECFGDPDVVHSYSYTPDVAAGLVALGTAEGGARGVWMLPVHRAESTRAVVARFARAMERDVAISRVPTWLLRAAGVFSPLMREVAEMAYQWQQPYTIDDAKFRRAFGFGPTGWDEAVAATVAWGREAYDPARKAATGRAPGRVPDLRSSPRP